MKIQRFDRYDGLVIDKSGTFQTICQIRKYYQTTISPNHVYGLYGYIGYRGIRVSSLYRRIPRISHIETLNVSHNETGDMAGNIKRYQTISIGHIRHMRDMRIYGLMV